VDWTWTRLDGSSSDWSIAGLVESLLLHGNTADIDFNDDSSLLSESGSEDKD